MLRRLAVLTFAACLCLPALAGEISDHPVLVSERAGLALTLYQDDNALVRDRRMVSLDKGPALLVWDGVAREARVATGMLSAPNLAVHSQGFDIEGASSERLLADAVGKEVTLVWRESGGAEREERARVLSAHGTPLFEVAGRVVAGQPARIIYDALPPGLRPQPTFTAAITADSGGKREAELAYMTGGLSWQADYTAEYNPGDSHITLSAWTTLSNTSGADFPQAQIALVAGRPNRVAEIRPRAMGAMMTAAAAPAAPPAEALGPYHLFQLPEPVTLRDGERIQAILLAPTLVKIERELILDPLPPYAWRGKFGETPRQFATAILKLTNTKTAGLGQPLPAGTLRVYQRGPGGTLAFMGEDHLPATPEQASAHIAIGQAFDVTAQRRQTDFQHVSAEVAEAAFDLHVANAGDKPATVNLRETFGGDWLVLEESLPHRREDAFTAKWVVTVPAKGETVVSYRVRVKG